MRVPTRGSFAEPTPHRRGLPALLSMLALRIVRGSDRAACRGRQSLHRSGMARSRRVVVESRDGLRREALTQRSAGQIESGHLLGAWMWVSMEPELCPICNPRFPGPVNVTLALESAILDNSLLVCVGLREPRAERQLLRRVRLSSQSWGWRSC
jgi:hypothetical protein